MKRWSQQSSGDHDVALSDVTGSFQSMSRPKAAATSQYIATRNAGTTRMDREKHRGAMKKNVERAYSEFLEGLLTAITEDDFRRVAERAAHAWGFRWFAYFGRQAHGSHLIS